MTITVTGILKSPQGTAINDAEILFEQTQSSTEVLQGATITVITDAMGQYSFELAIGTYILKIRQQNEANFKVVASNIIVINSMDNYSINQILIDQHTMEDIDYDILAEVFQARDQQIQAANEAETSQAAALASENAAEAAQAQSQGSATTAQNSAANAQTYATNAQNSATSAAASASSATASKNEAQVYQSNAGASQASALDSKTQAQASETSASISQGNSLASQNDSQDSAVQAQISEANALISRNEAQISALESAGSQLSAMTSKDEAQASAAQAANSEAAAQSSAAQATTQANNASGSASLQSTSAASALASENKAFKWQENPEDITVEPGKYSAKHWATKAQQSAGQAAGALIWRGGWSAQSGSTPPTPSGTQDFYRITQQGTILGVFYDIGDYIHWDTVNLIWFKLDGTDSVVSVNGQSGQVTLNQQDVGALPIVGGNLLGPLVITQDGGEPQTGTSSLVLNAPSLGESQFTFMKAGEHRWVIASAGAESGSNQGSDLALHAYSDDGSYGGLVFKVYRSTKQLEFSTQPLSQALQGTGGTALTRRDFVESQDALKVSKTGDTLSGNLLFQTTNTGILFDNGMIGSNNGIFAGNGDGASANTANLQIKSWYGVGIARTGSNPTGENSIWFDARTGNIETVGSLIVEGNINTRNTIYVAPTTGTSSLVLNANASGESQFTYMKAGKQRWMLGMDVIPESGSNAGSDLTLHSYNDDGSYGSPVFKVYRNWNSVEFFSQPFYSGPQLGAGNSLTRRDWVQGELDTKVNRSGDTMTGNLTTPKVLLSSQQGLESNAATRRDFVESYIASVGVGERISIIPLPAGAPETGYLPVIVTPNSRENTSIFIGTNSAGGEAPINSCSFDGKVFSGGWSDMLGYVSGVFTLYDSAERGIHSIQGSTQNPYFYCIYVEVRAFPIQVKVPIGVTVEATTGAIIGASTFLVNGHEGGNTNTKVLANFNRGSGVYENGDRVYNTSFLPSAYEIGAVAKTGDLMTGNLEFYAPGTGILLQNYALIGGGNGLFIGQGDGAGRDATNIQIKSWFGVGIASTVPSNPDNKNSIWFNSRTGDIMTVGGISTGNTIYVESQTGASSLVLNASISSESQFTYMKAGKNRWVLASAGTESGSNTGSDLALHAYNDDGSYSAPVLMVYRNTKQVEFFTQPFSSAPQDSAGNSLTRRDWVQGELNNKVSKNGDTISGALASTVPTGNWRIATNYGSFWHQDNNDLYLMLTNSGDQNGSFNSLRPLYISLSNGMVSMGSGLMVHKPGASIAINTPAGEAGYLRGKINDVDNWYVGRGEPSTNNISLSSSVLATDLTLKSDRIEVNKVIYAPDVEITSDARLKSNFEEILNPLEKVMKISGKIYDKKSIDSRVTELKREVGIIAQDVAEVLPEAVSNHEDILSISHSGVVALLVEAIKELKKEVDYLREKI